MGGLPPGLGERRLRIHLERTDSTMAEAARRLPSLQAPAWISADRQSAGRGRQGRSWQQAPGNLAATLVYRPEAAPAHRALRSFAAALALVRALEPWVPPALLALKWPNDVLLVREGETPPHAKLAGILLESLGDALLIGFGVNLVHAPPPDALPDAALPAASLRGALGVQVAPDALLDALDRQFAAEEARLAERGFAPLRADWLDRAAGRGRVMTARLAGGRSVTGRFQTVDATGALVLQAADGSAHRISAGDVFFAPAR